LTIGQGTASASSSTAFSLDLGTATTINQNTQGAPGTGTPPTGQLNAGDGWSFVVTGWVAGDQINILTGTPNGGPGVECNTAIPAGVNQTTGDQSNFVYFSGADTGGDATHDSPIIEATSGTVAPIIDTLVSQSPATVIPSGACPDTSSGSGDLLTLTFKTTAISTLDTAEVFLGYANSVGNPSSDVSEPVVFDTGFGAATGAVNFAATYNIGGSTAAAATSTITVPSDATVIGETPGGNVPATGINRITGFDIVAPTNISPFTISETGGFAPGAPTVTGFLPPFSGPQNTGTTHPPATEATNLGAVPPDGDVCLVLDNSTNQHLAFSATPTWSVNPGASMAGFSAAAGPATVLNGGLLLQLPVANPANSSAVWTAAGLQLATLPGFITEADGPEWAYVYYVFGTAASLTTNGGCMDTNADAWNFGVSFDANFPPGHQLAASPFIVANSGLPTSVYQLGYVQLTTVSELANSIYGATAVDTAAQTIGHQFDYAKGDCVGNQFPLFKNGGAIFVATANDYHDALGAAYPAGADDSGVLLTDPQVLSQAAADEIRNQGVQTVYLVGGNLAISNAVQNTLASTPSYECGGVTPRYNILGTPEDLTVIRIAGQTADDTNLLLATFPGAEPITPTPGPLGAYATPTLFNDSGSGISTSAPMLPVQNTAIIVTDQNFQDAVTGSVLAYGWPMPLIVTPPNALSLDALAALFNDHINQALVLGGTLAINDSVVTELGSIGVTALRIAGIDASDTSTQLASFELAAGAGPLIFGLPSVLGLGVNNNDPQWENFVARTAGIIAPAAFDNLHGHVVLLARGDYYGDAESAAVLAIHNGLFGPNANNQLFPMVLAESPSNLGTYVTSFLNKAGIEISGLAGELAAGGWSDGPNGVGGPDQDAFVPPGAFGPSNGEQFNDSSSSVFTVQPVGGPIALSPGVLVAALTAVTAG